jgi:hypothetical protein
MYKSFKHLMSTPSVRLLVLIFICVCIVGVWFFYTIPPSKESLPQDNAASLREATIYWARVIEEEGPDTAVTLFKKEAPTSPLPTHDHAHAFGEALYGVLGLDGLGYCDESYEFGCYHSFFGVAVAKEGIEVLPKFKDACVSRFPQMSMPCQHGIGHGVLVYTDYPHLVEALRLCQSIAQEPTGGCSSGVFMENNFHTMDETVPESYVRPPEGDLYAPCSILPETFQASCYLEQVQWWQNLGKSFKEIGALCRELPTTSVESYEACFHGVGNYAAASVNLEPQETAAICNTMPALRESALCYEGASWLLRGDGSNLTDAQLLCGFLPTPESTRCLKKLEF